MTRSRVVARGRNNILEPREPYELIGQVPNVVFPTGIVVEGQDDEGFARPDSRVRLYYGAADTCVGLAETTIGSAAGRVPDPVEPARDRLAHRLRPAGAAAGRGALHDPLHQERQRLSSPPTAAVGAT